MRSMTPAGEVAQCSKSKIPGKGLRRKSTIAKPLAIKIMGIKLDYSESDEDNHPQPTSGFETVKLNTIRMESEIESDASPQAKKPNIEDLPPTFDDFDVDEPSSKSYNPNFRLSYTYKEDEVILKYVLQGQNIFKVSSLSLWKNLESKKTDPKRTYQSLKNRFLRNIKPNLFTKFRHIINNKRTVENILLKFPELKRQSGTRKFLSEMKLLEVAKKSSEGAPIPNSINHETDRNKVKEELVSVAKTKSEVDDLDFYNQGSSPSDSPKIPYFERTVKVNQNLMKITISLSNTNDREVPLFPTLGLSERFKSLKWDNEGSHCPTCGRFYEQIPDEGSKSDAESDIIPDSVQTETKNVSSVSNKSPRKMSLRSWSSSNQNLLVSLEKSDKSQGNSEDSNSGPEDVPEKDESEEIIEIVDDPVKERISATESKLTNDTDIDLIYDYTVKRFHKLVDADQVQTLQRKCLNNDNNGVGFNVKGEKNVESFFLDTPMEMGTPSVTEDLPTQIQASSVRRQSERLSKSSVLASNMMKMMASSPINKKKS